MPDNVFNQDLDEEGYEVTNDVELVEAGRSSSGIDYICAQQGKKRAWVARAAYAGDASDAALALKAHGILLFGAAAKAKLVKDASTITRFPPAEIMGRIGHGENCFAYPDARVLSHDGRFIPAAFAAGGVCVTPKGTLDEWKEHVLPLMRNQYLPLFALFAAFAAPLLRLTPIQGNFMIMYSGPAGKGKSTMIDAAAGLCGPAADSEHGRYLRKFNNTMNRLEELLALYNDMPALIDELSSMGSVRNVQTDFRTMVHHLTGVDDRGRFGDALTAARQTRTLIQITSNDDLRTLLSFESADAAEGVEDRIIEIPVPRGDEGVFNAPNEKFADTNTLAFALTTAIKRYHGTAMPAFLQALVEQKAANPERFTEGLIRRVMAFAERPEVNRLGRISPRKKRLFGLIHVAGVLAKRYKLLPDDVDCGAVVTHCLRLHLGHRVEADPQQRLLSWYATNTLIDLRRVEPRSMTTIRLNRLGAFIGECRGEPELWMRPKLFRRSFPNSLALLRQLKQRGVLDSEGRGRDAHYARKRTVRRGQVDRVLVFRVPDLEEWLEQNGHPRPRRRGGKRKM